MSQIAKALGVHYIERVTSLLILNIYNIPEAISLQPFKIIMNNLEVNLKTCLINYIKFFRILLEGEQTLKK